MLHPKLLWTFVGPIGSHLDASIIHDYLYMAWTDWRDVATKNDWRFADLVYREGMRKSRVKKRWFIYRAVHSPIGWKVFKTKPSSLRDRMLGWEGDL